MRRPHSSVLWLLALLLAPAIPSAAQTYETIHEFSGDAASEGLFPIGALVQAADGDFYGTTYGGGNTDCGTVFRLPSVTASVEVVHTLVETQGCHPQAGLVQASDGAFYGVAREGGSFGRGTLFRLDNTQTPALLTVLHHFGGAESDGAGPVAALIQATDGRLYGTTRDGGAYGWGTVFRIDPTGANYETLVSFGSGNFEVGPLFGDYYSAGYVPPAVGAYPVAPLLQAGDGTFYGTTMAGGNPNPDQTPADDPYFRTPGGTVFQLIPPDPGQSSWTVIYHFNFEAGGGNGDTPMGALIQTSPTTFLGTTSDLGSILSTGEQSGTIFELDRSEDLFGLYTRYAFTNVDGNAIGAMPAGALVDANGAFYGTTLFAGPGGGGIVFRLNPNGEVEVVHGFDSADVASLPYGPLIKGADGMLYGTAGGRFVLVDWLAAGDSAGAIFRLQLTSDQTIDFASLPDRVLGDADFAVGATATSGLPVTFSASGSCTVAGALVSLTTVGTCTITASQAGNGAYTPAPDVSRTFSISNPAVTLTLSTASVTGGTSTTATVTLTSPTPITGAVVNLSSSAPGIAEVPTSVSIMKNKTSKAFTISTAAVDATIVVHISASYGGTTVTRALTVTAPPVTLSTVSVNPKAVKGGMPATVTVTLSRPAPAGGVLVAVTSSRPAVAPDSTVSVPAGATSATTTVETQPVTAVTDVSFSATVGEVTRISTLTVKK